jgi:hypothetical protein
VPSIPADRPPSGPDWVHEIKHDGYRLMGRRDSVGIRLLTRNGHDWAPRYPLIVEAMNALKVRSCLPDRRRGRGVRREADTVLRSKGDAQSSCVGRFPVWLLASLPAGLFLLPGV